MPGDDHRSLCNVRAECLLKLAYCKLKGGLRYQSLGASEHSAKRGKTRPRGKGSYWRAKRKLELKTRSPKGYLGRFRRLRRRSGAGVDCGRAGSRLMMPATVFAQAGQFA